MVYSSARQPASQPVQYSVYTICPSKSTSNQYRIVHYDFRLLPAGAVEEPSSVAFFIIVSFPEDAALTIDRSIDLLIFAVSDCFMVACLMSTGFFGAICLWPFFVLAAAFAA